MSVSSPEGFKASNHELKGGKKTFSELISGEVMECTMARIKV